VANLQGTRSHHRIRDFFLLLPHPRVP
jgi:hypothetical protein